MTFSKEPVTDRTVQDLAFLTGQWKGHPGNGIIEEHWMSNTAENMTGMFRWIKGDSVSMYELMAIVRKEENITFYLRHFHPDFIGWEEKENPIELVLTDLSDNKALFVNSEKPDEGWFAYHLVDDETLTFTDYEPDGSVAFELTFKRMGIKSVEI
jgi:hypothetical protein